MATDPSGDKIDVSHTDNTLVDIIADTVGTRTDTTVWAIVNAEASEPQNLEVNAGPLTLVLNIVKQNHTGFCIKTNGSGE